MSTCRVGNYENYSAYKPEKSRTSIPASENTGIPAANDMDSFEKSNVYHTDFGKVSAMKQALWNKIDAFENMVNTLFQRQGVVYKQSESIRDNLERLMAAGGVDQAELLAAQQAIGEDGEWGAEKTAQRILDFAKALCGGDPSKIELLRDAVQKGFSQAEKLWGGQLPDVCGHTYDRVMQLFDEWANPGTPTESIES